MYKGVPEVQTGKLRVKGTEVKSTGRWFLFREGQVTCSTGRKRGRRRIQSGGQRKRPETCFASKSQLSVWDWGSAVMPQCVSLIQSRQEDVCQTLTNPNKWPRKTHSFFLSYLQQHIYRWWKGAELCFIWCGGCIVLEMHSTDSQWGMCQLPPCSCQPGAESEGGGGGQAGGSDRRQLTGGGPPPPLPPPSVSRVCRLSDNDSRHTRRHVTLLFVWPILIAEQHPAAGS